MCKILPDYLSLYAKDYVEKKNNISFKLKCTCGKENFTIYTNKKKYKNKDPFDNPFDNYWKSLKVPIFSIANKTEKKTGRTYWYGSTFFGIHVGKFYDDMRNKEDSEKNINVIKLKCSNCGKEIIAFDNRLYGYDAVTEIKPTEIHDLKYRIIKLQPDTNSTKIEIKVINDLSYNEFLECTQDNFNEKEYSNAFSTIIIYAITNNKRKKIFEEETC